MLFISFIVGLFFSCAARCLSNLNIIFIFFRLYDTTDFLHPKCITNMLLSLIWVTYICLKIDTINIIIMLSGSNLHYPRAVFLVKELTRFLLRRLVYLGKSKIFFLQCLLLLHMRKKRERVVSVARQFGMTLMARSFRCLRNLQWFVKTQSMSLIACISVVCLHAQLELVLLFLT